MGLMFGCVCRNGSKAYIEVSGSSLDKSSISVVTENGTACAHMAIALTSTSFVLVVPLLSVSMTVRVESGKSSIHMTYSPSMIKWLSRLNYRLNPKTTEVIKDIDYADPSIPFFEFQRCIPIPAKHSFVVRGLLHAPADSDLSPEDIEVYDDTFANVLVKVNLMGNSSMPTTSSFPLASKIVGFTVTVPDSYRAVFFRQRGTSRFDGMGPEFFREAIDTYHQEILNASCDPDYHRYYLKHKASLQTLAAQAEANLAYSPFFSVVVPLFNTPVCLFDEMVLSVLRQSYKNFELVLVNASPENEELRIAVESVALCDSRVKIVTLKENLGISFNTREGINKATGDYVCFLDHDDTLEPNALFEYAYALNEDPLIDLLYCDEDKLMPDGKHAMPYFKPDFSPYLEREINYMCHFLAARKSLVDQTGCDSVFDGAQDHRMILQLMRLGAHVKHIPLVLYHWRITPQSTAGGVSGTKPYANTAGKLAVEEHLRECNIAGTVQETEDACRYKVDYSVNGNPLVSIIIPNKDNRDLLDCCISSILHKSTWSHYEIIVVENNSTEDETFDYYREVQSQHDNVKVVFWEGPFNYSAINNYGATFAQGDHLILLNNDTEIIAPSWMEEMLGICQNPQVGAVGAKLLYLDGTVQHGGVYVQGEGPGHINLSLSDEDKGYFNTACTTREVTAVTGACLMVSKKNFDLVEGLDEDFAVAFNDVDFCLKLINAGKTNVFNPNAKLFHYESFSRGYETTREKQLRFHRERSRLTLKWPEIFVFGDPYMNPNLNNLSGYFKLQKED